MKALFSVLLVFFATDLLAQGPAQSVSEEKANRIMLQVRSATLDPGAVSKIKGLSMECEFYPAVPVATMTETAEPKGRPQHSELHLDFLLPGRFRETEINTVAGATLVQVTGWNKGYAWTNLKSPDTSAKTLDVGEVNAKQAGFARAIYSEFITNLMIFLIAAPELAEFHYSYAGPSSVAGTTVSMIDVSGPDQLELRLLVDEAAHQLRGIRYTGTLPYVLLLNAGSESALRRSKLHPLGGGIRIHPHRRWRSDVEIEILLDDFRLESELFLLLPHKIVFRANRRIIAEEEVRKVTVNPEELKPQIVEPASTR